MNMSFSDSLQSAKDRATKIGGWLQLLPWVVAQYAFVVLLVLILLAFFVGEYLFYQYVIVPKTQGPENVMQPVLFREATYESVNIERQQRQSVFENPTAKNYQDPFK